MAHSSTGPPKFAFSHQASCIFSLALCITSAATFSMSAALAPGFAARTTSRMSRPKAVNAVQPLVVRGVWGDLRPPAAPLGPLPCSAASSPNAMSCRGPGSLAYCFACTPRNAYLTAECQFSGKDGQTLEQGSISGIHINRILPRIGLQVAWTPLAV